MLDRKSFESDEAFQIYTELVKEFGIVHLNLEDGSVLKLNDIDLLRKSLEDVHQKAIKIEMSNIK